MTETKKGFVPMIRIIDGFAYESSVGDSVRLKAYDLGNGHLEVSGVRETVWRESDMSPLAIEMYLESLERHRLDTEDERAAQRLKIAANRAKKNVRRLCKVMGANTLLTLTYRANITDLAQCKKDLREFVRRLRRVVPDFRAVACFEQQDRGCWHVHLATVRFPAFLTPSGCDSKVKVKSFNVIRAVWRSVAKESGGNVDVSNTKRGANRSPAKIAAYIAKYIAKAFTDGEAGSNRWTRFGAVEIPVPLDLGRFPDMRSLVEAAYSLVDGCAKIVDKHLSKWNDWFFLVAEGQSLRAA